MRGLPSVGTDDAPPREVLAGPAGGPACVAGAAMSPAGVAEGRRCKTAEPEWDLVTSLLTTVRSFELLLTTVVLATGTTAELLAENVGTVALPLGSRVGQLALWPPLSGV